MLSVQSLRLVDDRQGHAVSKCLRCLRCLSFVTLARTWHKVKPSPRVYVLNFSDTANGRAVVDQVLCKSRATLHLLF